MYMATHTLYTATHTHTNTCKNFSGSEKYVHKEKAEEAGEGLRAFVALAEDLGSVPSTSMAFHNQ